MRLAIARIPDLQRPTARCGRLHPSCRENPAAAVAAPPVPQLCRLYLESVLLMLLLLEVGGHRQGLLERRVLLLLLLLCSETDCRRLPRSAATVRPGVMHEAARREAHARG